MSTYTEPPLTEGADALSLRLDDLEPIAIPFTWGKDKEGNPKKYVLREASEDAAVKYRNAVQRSFRTNSAGEVIGVDGMADAAPLLVSLCVFEINPPGGKGPEGPVSLTWVRSLPHKLVQRLFGKAQAISDLLEDTEESLTKQIDLLQKRLAKLREGKSRSLEDAAKNGQEGTMPTYTTPPS